MTTPKDLIIGCKNGDPVAYTRLYELHAKYVYNTICRYIEHTGEAEDILQESFVEAYQSIHRLANEESFRPWIKRIAINKAVNAFRKRKLDLIALEPDTPCLEEVTEDEEAFAWTMDQISRAIEALPPMYRTVFQLFAVEDIPQAEIAQLLGLSHSAVRVQYFRARNKVLQTLKEKPHER